MSTRAFFTSSRRPFAFAAILAFTLSTVSTAKAVILETRDWAVTSKIEAALGYDNRPYLRAGSDDATYAETTAILHLFRRSSLTRFEVDFALRATEFIDGGDEGSVDPMLSLLYRFPASENGIPRQEIRASASRRTEPNVDVGERLRHTRVEAGWEGQLITAGRLNVLGRLFAGRTDYATDIYNRSDVVRGGVTAAFVSTERLQLGAGYDISMARSIRVSPDCVTRRLGHAFTLRGRGEFMPKLSGEIFIGADYADYSGCLERHDWDLIAGGALTWTASERRLIEISIDRRTYYSPSGDSVAFNRVGLEFVQRMAGGFRGRLGAEYSKSRFEDETVFRRDHAFGLLAGVDYGLTDRFTATLELAYRDQSSDQRLFDFDRTHVRIRAGYAF